MFHKNFLGFLQANLANISLTDLMRGALREIFGSRAIPCQ